MPATPNLHFAFGRKLDLVLQTEASECGLACLAMIASFFGHHTDLSEMRKRFPISLKGATLEQLVDISDQLGMVSRALRLELSELNQLQTPALLHWDMNHFVVLKTVKGNKIYIHDPAIGEVCLTKEQISEHFTGVALELHPGIAFQRKPPPPPVQIGQLIGKVVGLRRGLLQLILLALVLECLSIVLPILTEWITDEAIVSGDNDLLTMLGLGMLAIGICMAVIAAVRTWVGLYISTNFNMQWMSNVMGHLLKLPIEYFEKRHLGDIVSRFGAVHAIEHTLTTAAVEALLDGMMVIGTLCMMLIYSAKLTMIAGTAVLLYALLRWSRFSSIKLAQTGVITKNAKEQTYFLETVRGVRSIKLYNRENQRRSAWMNLWVDATNAGLTLAKLNLFFGTSWSFLATFERAGVFWLGAHAVIRHDLSLGMLLAFLSYKEQFTGRMNQLIDRVIEFKMMSIQTERLADIVLTAPEESFGHRKHDIPDDLTLSLDKVSFRYASEDHYILNNASLTVRPGECIAIVGASGCGKTTALKLMLGILQPASGKIQIGGKDGASIKQIGLRQYRQQIATVMQDDQLFAGSLFDNICFLDVKPDDAWVQECAKTAGIHNEILAMPMGYHTLVGDMGTVLSGGQKQRILLARALYRRPKILFLDEATSHLDIENESRIGEAIASLDITRIMIAHRPQTIAIADRVVKLEGGKFSTVPKNVSLPHTDSASAERNVSSFPPLHEAANTEFTTATTAS